MVDRTFFDDLSLGQRLSVGEWLVKKEEAVEFARTWEPQPQHVDEDAASASDFQGLTVCSLYLFAVCTRLFFDYERPLAVLAMLGKDRIQLPHPARPGDRLRYETECLQSRPSRSRPMAGVVVLGDSLSNQAGEPVLTQEVALLVARRPSA